MSSRRLKPDEIVYVAKFLHDAHAIHEILVGYTSRLRTSSPSYKALEKVHAELMAAIVVVTGTDAPWVRREPLPDIGP